MRTVKSCLLLAHRWVSLVLLPFFLLLIVTGAILAFRPVTEAVAPPADGVRVINLLERIDPQGQAKSVEVSAPDQVDVQSNDVTVRYDLRSGKVLNPDVGAPFFATVKKLHKDLLLDLDLLMEIMTYAMLAVVLAGPFLAWLVWRNSLLGWHLAVGWCLFPLLVMIPLTAVLMELKIGSAVFPTLPQSTASLSLSQALLAAEANGVVLTDLVEVSHFKKNTILIETRQDGFGQKWLVGRDRTVAPLTEIGLPKALHEGRWGEIWPYGGIISGLVSFLGAVALGLLVVTGVWSFARRKVRNLSNSGRIVRDINGTTVVVAHASQTGTATRLAKTISKALTEGGNDVVLASLDAVTPDNLRRARLSLLVVSTAGNGEVPEGAHPFMNRIANGGLDGARFALLALGDSHYPQFCGGGKAVRAALKAAGAEEVLSMRTIDGEPKDDAAYWLEDLAEAADVSSGTIEVEKDQQVCVTLTARTRLDNPQNGDTTEAWDLEFSSMIPMIVRPGDLMVVTPAPDAAPRFYSIGGTARPGCRALSLTVALNQWQDSNGATQFGLASGLLCRDLKVGDTLHVTLRPREDFNPPDDPARPIIMIASGCGIAPFTGFINERANALRFGITPGPAWLIFGNRYRDRDYLHQEKLEFWQRQQVLTRLDLAFSRDGSDKTYVQNVLEQNANEFLRWVREDKAIVYVCGRARTMGVSLEKSLIFIFERNLGLAPDAAKDMLLHWRTDGTIRFDLFG